MLWWILGVLAVVVALAVVAFMVMQARENRRREYVMSAGERVVGWSGRAA